MEKVVFKNTIEGSPVLSPQSIKDSVLPKDIKDFMIKNLPWKDKTIEMVPAHDKISRKVTGNDIKQVKEIAQAMRDWMKTKYKCVGLAHPQVDNNDPMAFFITLQEPYIIILNPKIVSTGVSNVRSLEGCMTYPQREHIYHDRHKVITVEYEVFKGKKMVKKTKLVAGFLALVYQHEIDHLNGKYYYDN